MDLYTGRHLGSSHGITPAAVIVIANKNLNHQRTYTSKWEKR